MNIYELEIGEDLDSEFVVDKVSLVDKPAIKSTWLAFEEQSCKLNFASVDYGNRMVVGAAMIPDMKIYRKDDKTGEEYYVVFSKNTISKIAERFFAKNFHLNATMQHDEKLQVKGITYFLSWIKNDELGFTGMQGDYPDGTWFLGAKVDDENTLEKIKAGEIRGFSIEGNFIYKPAKTEEEKMYDEIKNILSRTEA